jgi:ubiquinone/menaquinone biosynthesis C-methylase UbiE
MINEKIIEQYNSYHELFNTSKEINFMNHGYFPFSSVLKKEDLLFKFESTLYLELFKNINTENLTLLDVGCGRGGGLNILNKYFKFKELYGCDINSKAINYCQKNFKNINFKISNAEKLDYNDKTFDLITNVESFHCYKNKNFFLKETYRVLKKEGSLLMTDINLNFNLDNSFNDYFKLTYYLDITPNVAFACKNNIKNFSSNIEDKELRYWLVNLSEKKFFSYLNDHTYFIVHLTKI